VLGWLNIDKKEVHAKSAKPRRKERKGKKINFALFACSFLYVE